MAVNDSTLIKTGIIGSVVAAICCFTPLLVIVLGAVGLSAWLGVLDYVLFPALGLFLAIAAYGLWRRRRGAACCSTRTGSDMRRTGHGACDQP